MPSSFATSSTRMKISFAIVLSFLSCLFYLGFLVLPFPRMPFLPPVSAAFSLPEARSPFRDRGMAAPAGYLIRTAIQLSSCNPNKIIWVCDYTKHICLCQVLNLNKFVLVYLDRIKQICYTPCDKLQLSGGFAMAIAERIHFFRNLRGLTQKALGLLLEFPESSADVRIAQYETGKRTPKDEVKADLAVHLGISALALTVPDIDTFEGLMHTLFALEDRIGLRAVECDGKPHLLVDPEFSKSSAALHQAVSVWCESAAKLKAGEITREEYDAWRYNYPLYATPDEVLKPRSALRIDPETGHGYVKVWTNELDELSRAVRKKQKRQKKDK